MIEQTGMSKGPGKISRSEVKPIAQNALQDQAVCTAGHSNSNAEIDLPLRRKIQVDSRKDLLFLLCERVETRNRPESAVVFQAPGDFGREVVTELEIRRKLKTLVDAKPVEGLVEGGIERPVPAAHLFVNNGADFPRPGIRREFPALVANLVGNAHPHRPMPAIRDANARPDVVAHPVPAVAAPS